MTKDELIKYAYEHAKNVGVLKAALDGFLIKEGWEGENDEIIDAITKAFYAGAMSCFGAFNISAKFKEIDEMYDRIDNETQTFKNENTFRKKRTSHLS